MREKQDGGDTYIISVSQQQNNLTCQTTVLNNLHACSITQKTNEETNFV